MNQTAQRELWNGNAVELETVWSLTKRGHVAQCVLFSHRFGWDLRLDVGELFRAQACRSTDEIRDVQESWKAAMIEKGWS